MPKLKLTVSCLKARNQYYGRGNDEASEAS